MYNASKYFYDDNDVIGMKGNPYMEIFNKIKAGAKAMTEVGVGLIALAIVLEVLFKGQAIPFLGSMNVIGNVSAIVKSFSADGLVGLVAMYVLYSIYKKQ